MDFYVLQLFLAVGSLTGPQGALSFSKSFGLFPRSLKGYIFDLLHELFQETIFYGLIWQHLFGQQRVRWRYHESFDLGFSLWLLATSLILDKQAALHIGVLVRTLYGVSKFLMSLPLVKASASPSPTLGPGRTVPCPALPYARCHESPRLSPVLPRQ